MGPPCLGDCLGSLYQYTRDVGYEVILADDCSTDHSVEFVRQHFPQVRIHVNPTNLGFARTNNAALPLVRGRHLFLLNNDTVLQNDALAELAGLLDRHPNVGICGGRLFNPDGSQQHSCGSFPSVATELGSLLSLRRHGLFRRWPNLAEIPAPDETLRTVDYIVGADLMIRTSLARQLGLFDLGFAAYFEDADLCARVRQSGHQVMCTSASRITHLVGQSYGNDRTGPGERKTRLFEAGFVRFCRRHYPSARVRLILALRIAGFQKKIASLRSRLSYEPVARRPRVERALASARLSLAALRDAIRAPVD